MSAAATVPNPGAAIGVSGRPVKSRRPLLGWHIHDGFTVSKRNLIQTIRVPELLFFSLVQPVIFVLMFAYVFGGAIPVPGSGGGSDAYRQYLIPGIFGQTVAFAAAASTVGISEDMSKGIIDRFRSLPMRASAVLFGRTFADAARMVLVLAVLSLTGLVVGWRINDGALYAFYAYLLLLLFAYTMAWIGSWVGLYMPNPETANTAGLLWLFPLTFISNAFVPLAGMPPGLQAVAAWNPLSALVLSCRELFGNDLGQISSGGYWSLEHPVAYTLISCAVLLAVFVPLSVRKYRTSTVR
ncbi:MAG: ABC transporter permease [Actinomycetes bacterium]